MLLTTGSDKDDRKPLFPLSASLPRLHAPFYLLNSKLKVNRSTEVDRGMRHRAQSRQSLIRDAVVV
jgi:hypothetical protein